MEFLNISVSIMLKPLTGLTQNSIIKMNLDEVGSVVYHDGSVFVKKERAKDETEEGFTGTLWSVEERQQQHYIANNLCKVSLTQCSEACSGDH
jgi:6-phosphofructokinase